MAERQDTPVLDALEGSVKAAAHLTPADAAAVQAARALALKIDMADRYFEELADSHAERNLRPPSQDNVSIPTFLKYCESLGLTPAGRKVPAQADPAKGGAARGSGGALGRLQGIAGGKAG